MIFTRFSVVAVATHDVARDTPQSMFAPDFVQLLTRRASIPFHLCKAGEHRLRVSKLGLRRHQPVVATEHASPLMEGRKQKAAGEVKEPDIQSRYHKRKRTKYRHLISAACHTACMRDKRHGARCYQNDQNFTSTLTSRAGRER